MPDALTPDDQLLQEFYELPDRHKTLVLVRWLFQRLHRLVVAKRTTALPILPMNDIEPNEEELYQEWRRLILFCLQGLGLCDLVARATRLMPERLLTITTGRVDEWDHFAASDLAADLTALCTDAGLNRFRTVPGRLLRSIDSDISWIATRTNQLSQIAFALKAVQEAEEGDASSGTGETVVESPPVPNESHNQEPELDPKQRSGTKRYRVKATWEDIRDVCHEMWDERKRHGDNYRPSMEAVVKEMRRRGFSISKSTIINRFKDAGIDYPGPPPVQ